MEVEWFENVATEENVLQVDADNELQVETENDASVFDGERCGICMDIIIDRGVLDCCQHWFCFTCIDNWSTITNLCPLCQNEFQLITCVPVYDTIGSNNTDEDSVSRDGDWSVEGKSSTLSFPSYYIDENAVTCLDGDGCKLRSGSVTLDENLAFDTSIACDSCDTWYHAFCVGFDTESTSVESWLCPRCLVDEEYKLDANATELGDDQCHPENAMNQCSVDIFSGKVSISVADDGETAVVVSLLDQKNHVEQPTERPSTTLCPGSDKEYSIDQSRWATPETSSANTLALSSQSITNDLPNTEAGDLGLCAHSNHKSNFEGDVICRLSSFNDSKITSIKCPVSIGESTSDVATAMRAEQGSIIAVSVDDNVNSIQDGADEWQCSSSPRDLSADESNSQADLSVVTGEKRRRKSYSAGAHASDQKGVQFATEGLSRELNIEQNVEGTSAVGQPDTDAVNIPQEVGHERISSRNEHVGLESAKEESSVDITSIVQGTESKILSRKPVNNPSERRDAAGPRVKKIVRRPVENKESSVQVQNLRKEIREAVRGKPSEDVGKSIFDQKLLAAFRAAVAIPDAEPVRKLSSSIVKEKRLVLQKSKTRENLTKKIYATACGKRRHAWHRDCEVEFWKRRCPKTTKSEKIETLKSVLSLLKTDTEPEATEVEKGTEERPNHPILSRLYLADSSVFPRKDNIRPLSALEASSSHVSTLTEGTGADNTNKTASSSSAPLKSSTSCLDNKKNKSNSSSIKTGAVSNKTSLSADSASNSQKGKIGKPDDIKIDKRKWAMQVLARKTASKSESPGQQKEEDAAVLKGNYPLLAQLPADMRPKLESCCHNRIPNSVRQAQLYRLAENLLRMTNISPIRKTAATELAVADATNIEREIANRSKSKVVYLNLCSQELRHHKSTESQSAVEDSNPSTPSTVSTEREPSNSSSSLDPDVEKALKSAGLIADSPPSSTCHGDEDLNDGDEAKAEGPDNVLEMDSHPDMDIYGEFEYDLGDEDYIGASAIKVSKLQMEEGESKMKVVFSTLNTEKQDTALSCETLDSSTDKLASSSCASQSDCQNDLNDENFIKDDNKESLSLPPDSTDEGREEPTPTECEELYGPDKEPLFGRFPLDNHAFTPGMKSELGSGKMDPTNSVAKMNSNSQPDEENNPGINVDKQQRETNDSVMKQVQAYIKEHIRPLCKSGVITVDQYRWAVGKTTDKVMKYHSKAKNANFLIKEGEKVKKLAEQYVEAAKLKDKDK